VATPNGNVPYSVASQYQTVTVGVNYKFGGPVVARY
jgi:outer membrane immunogenic protein